MLMTGIRIMNPFDSTIIIAPAEYAELSIAQQTNPDHFKQQLKVHQQGGTDYLTFCRDCANAGIEKWVIDLPAMTCTYFNTVERVYW